MRRITIIVGAALITVSIACNAPSRSTAEPTISPAQLPTEGIGTQEPAATNISTAATATSALPDVQGTVNAQPSATIDPNSAGTIKGRIGYSGSHPAMRIYAISTSGQKYQYIQVQQGATTYSLELPAGEYYVLADVTTGDGVFEGGYSMISACAKDGEDTSGCKDLGHSLIAVQVQAG